MLRLTRGCVTAVTLALLMPAAAGAIPISFQFSGIVDKTGGEPGLAEGDPLTATFSYDTDVWNKIDDDGDNILYSGGVLSFEMRAGTHSWSAGQYMRVWKAGDRVDIGLSTFFGLYVRLEGTGLLPAGGAPPTSIDFAAMTFHQVFGRGLEHTMDADFLSMVQTQGPDLVAAPEPATLTLSAIGLAALLARRRRTRVTRVWHAGGEVFHAATKTRP